MRWLRFLLIVCCFIGQSHLCQYGFRLPDGTNCEECLTLQDVASPSMELVSAGEHGDCHDCCVLDSCDDHSKMDAVAASTTYFPTVVDLPTSLPIQHYKRLNVVQPIGVHVDGTPANGPPRRTSSRAPPTNPIFSSSAGRRFVDLA